MQSIAENKNKKLKGESYCEDTHSVRKILESYWLSALMI